MYAQGNQIPSAGHLQTRTYTTPPPPPPPPRGYNPGGSWVTVPGQYVDGRWIPEHKIQVPSGSGEQVPTPRLPPPQEGPSAPSPP
jgi:hypothetical protein